MNCRRSKTQPPDLEADHLHRQRRRRRSRQSRCNPNVKRVEEYAAKEGAQVVAVSAKIEAEIAELPDDEAEVFLEELGLPESGLDKLIKASYSLLGLINFFTAGSDEVRAWTIVNGTKAQKAAGKIHTDIERGFIRARRSPTKTSLPSRVKRALRKPARCAPKARTTSFRTATS